jgi:hypothetical protein
MEVWGLRLYVEAERRRQHRLGASGGISDNGEVGRALDLREGAAWRCSRPWQQLLQCFGGGKGDDGSAWANRCGLEEACGRVDPRVSKPKLIKNLGPTQPMRCVRLKS